MTKARKNGAGFYLRLVAFGAAVAASLYWLADTLAFPAIFYFRPEFIPGFGWWMPLLVVSVLVGLGAFLMIRQWQWKRFWHDLVAALVLPALLAIIATGLLWFSAGAHSRAYELAVPNLKNASVTGLENAYESGIISERYYVENCRLFRKWIYAEQGIRVACRDPHVPTQPLADKDDLDDFVARLTTTREALDAQAMVLRVAGTAPWLFLLAGLLLAGFVQPRRGTGENANP